MLKVYDALAGSVLRYGILAWGNANQTLLERLKRMQKALLRIVHNKQEKYPKPNLFKKYEILPVDDLFKYNLIKCKYFDMSHKNITEIHHDRRLVGNHKKYIEPITNNKHGNRELRASVPRIFNEIQ